MAKTKMSESISLYIVDQVKTANEFAIKGDFQNAIANIDLLLGVNPNDENAKNLKKKYEEDLNKKNEVKNVVTTENEKEAATSASTVTSNISVCTNITDGTYITSKFTDKYFKRYVYSLIGKTSPSPILYSDVKNIKVLNVNVGKDWHIVQDYTYDIYSLSGLEYFTALTFLECRNNQLTALFSIKDTWPTESYKPQYTDSSHINTTNSLVITIKD